MNNNKFYVYIHRRLTDGKVFYVGKGCKDRANSTHGRNSRWLNIVKKHGFTVEIPFDNLSEEEAFQIEVDTIKEMRYHFEEFMCNLTDGGEGASGYKWDLLKHPAKQRIGTKLTKEHRDKIGDSLRGKKRSQSAVLNVVKSKETYVLGSKVFSWMKKVLKGKLPVQTGFLEKILGISDRSLHKKGKHVVSRVAIDNSAAKRRGKPAHNSGKKQPSTTGKLNPSADNNVYTFEHTSGELFTGTRYEICEKYSINLAYFGKLFYKKPIKSAKGWSLLRKESDGT